MFYVINYENGATRYGNFNCFSDAFDYAESFNGGFEFTVEEYYSEDDYINSL